MNAEAAVARLFDIGGRGLLRLPLTTEARGHRARLGVSLPLTLLEVPARGGPKCPHCGARRR